VGKKKRGRGGRFPPPADQLSYSIFITAGFRVRGGGGLKGKKKAKKKENGCSRCKIYPATPGASPGKGKETKRKKKEKKKKKRGTERAPPPAPIPAWMNFSTGARRVKKKKKEKKGTLAPPALREPSPREKNQ